MDKSLAAPSSAATLAGMRPILVRGLHQLWRDQNTLQLGLHPPQAVILANLDAETRAIISQLDGRHTLTELLADLEERGQDPTQLTNLLTLLQNTGAIQDGEPETGLPPWLPSAERRRLAPDLAALSLHQPHAATTLANRTKFGVLVAADGRFGAVLAALLAASGIGRVHVWAQTTVSHTDLCPGGLINDDVGRPYMTAAHEAIKRAAPHTATYLNGAPDLLVITRPDRPTPAHRWARTAPHLVVDISEGRASIGPLVVPGVTACLRCIDQHRSDRDPDWPVLAAQLATETKHVEAAQLSTVISAAAFATAQALHFLDSGNATIMGGAVELSDRTSHPSHRTWQPHPCCDCGAHGTRTTPALISQ